MVWKPRKISFSSAPSSGRLSSSTSLTSTSFSSSPASLRKSCNRSSDSAKELMMASRTGPACLACPASEPQAAQQVVHLLLARHHVAAAGRVHRGAGQPCVLRGVALFRRRGLHQQLQQLLFQI